MLLRGRGNGVGMDACLHSVHISLSGCCVVFPFLSKLLSEGGAQL